MNEYNYPLSIFLGIVLGYVCNCLYRRYEISKNIEQTNTQIKYWQNRLEENKERSKKHEIKMANLDELYKHLDEGLKQYEKIGYYVPQRVTDKAFYSLRNWIHELNNLISCDSGEQLINILMNKIICLEVEKESSKDEQEYNKKLEEKYLKEKNHGTHNTI